MKTLTRIAAIVAIMLAPIVFAQAQEQTPSKEGCCVSAAHAGCCKAGHACHKADGACCTDGESCKEGTCCEGGACGKEGCCSTRNEPADRKPGAKTGCCVKAPK
jgi:hypothetical protein